LVTDQTINLFLPGGTFAQANVYLSAARVAERIAIRFARQVNSISSGDDSVNYGSAHERAAFYKDLVSDLIALGSTGDSAPRPFLGGSSYADKAAREADTDRVMPSFTRSDGPSTALTDPRYWP
jgi:hypothetical protein